MKPAVLIVDDSLTVRMDLADALSSAGFAVTLAETLAAARARLSEERFALVVLDVMLPDGDGIALLGEIKRATVSVPVIMLTSEMEVRDRVRGLTGGADAYIGKPYDRERLAEQAHALIRRASVEPIGDQPRTILVIDDSATFRDALQSALSAAGYAVVTAATGEEGLQAAASIRPRALIVDGIMPGIDGNTVLRRLRLDGRLRSTPCLLLTGSEASDDERRALDAGADAYVRKTEDMAIILARLAALVRHSDVPAMAAETALGTKKILAVDDSETYLHTLEEALRAEGYDVRLARSGHEALELLAVESMDCILLDLRMPGLSGEETCRRIKISPAWREIPLIMLTALEERQAMIAGINAGADDYIVKSASLDVLMARLRAMLRRRAFEEENRRIRDELAQREIEAKQMRAARALAEARATLLRDLELKNDELARANRQMERAKEQAERESQFKSRFLANMSHELRTPLNAIIGFSDLLQQESFGPLNRKQKDYVGHVLSSGHHLLSLINDVLDISKIEAGKLELRREWLSLGLPIEAVREVVAPLAEKQGVTLELALPSELPELFIDPVRIKQVLYNLLSNGIKFTRKGGMVRLSAENDGKRARIAVADTGIGIRKEDLPRLFREFEQLEQTEIKAQGTGLGLALSRRLVELHGGAISVKSELGKGTTFTVELPVARSPRPVASLESDPGPRESLVLVVEDDRAAAELIASHLCAAGLAVAFAGDGDQAMRLATELRPAAITLDVLMPRVDGLALLSRLKSSPALVDIPVVIISVVDEANRGLVLGAHDYLVKPVSREALLASLQASGVPLQSIDGLRVLLVSRDGSEIEGHLRNAGCRVDRAPEPPTATNQPFDVLILDVSAQLYESPRIDVAVNGSARSIPVLQVIDTMHADSAQWRSHLSRLARADALQADRLVRAVRQAVDRVFSTEASPARPILAQLRQAIHRGQREKKPVALVGLRLNAPPDHALVSVLRRSLRAGDAVELVDEGTLGFVVLGLETGALDLFAERLCAAVGQSPAARVEQRVVVRYPADGVDAEALIEAARARVSR